MPSTPGRVAVIGDVGGHLIELVEALIVLGMDPDTGLLPPDLSVVQVGDLVHRGPHSAQVVGTVDQLMALNPGRWAQLIGNHEQLYVSDPVFVWNEDIGAEGAAALNRWWESGRMRPAAAIVTPDGSWLATHAGLTVGFWRFLHCPADAQAAAAAINSLDRGPHSPLWRAGAMLGSARRSLKAGPVWASADQELLPGWVAPDSPPMPFHQVHGHSNAVNHSTGKLWTTSWSTASTTYDPVRAQETTTLACGTRIVGVDPGHGHQPARRWAPLVLTDAYVTW